MPRPTSPRPRGAGEAGATALGEFHHRDAVGELEGGLEALRQPLGDVGAHHHAVHHDVDVVVEFLVERRRGRDLVERAVDLDALEALLEVLREFLAVLALASAHHRGQQIEPRAFRQRQHPVDHLRHRLALDRQAGGGRIGDADARPQQAHVIVDLGDGADGGTRILRGRFLLDGDRRRQPVDLVDVGLLHHLQELARIGRQALHIAALAFRIDGVEGERGLAGPRQSREHHQPVARDFQVDILEVVLAGAADGDDPAAVEVAARTAIEQVIHARVPADLCASLISVLHRVVEQPSPRIAQTTNLGGVTSMNAPAAAPVEGSGCRRASPVPRAPRTCSCTGDVDKSWQRVGEAVAKQPTFAAMAARLGWSDQNTINGRIE